MTPGQLAAHRIMCKCYHMTKEVFQTRPPPTYLSSFPATISLPELLFVIQSLSRVWLFMTPWTVACQAFRSFTIYWSLLKLTSIQSVMPSNHLILLRLLLLLPSIFPSIRVFSSESALIILQFLTVCRPT